MTRHHLQIFQLPAGPDHLLLQDLSQYRDEFGPEYPRLNLTLPGYSEGLELPFNPSETNVYTKEQLGGGLPDGIYRAIYSVAPHDRLQVCYQFLRTEDLNCRINEWIRGRDWTYEPTNSAEYQKLIRVTGLVLAAQAEITHDPSRALSYYSIANRLVG